MLDGKGGMVWKLRDWQGGDPQAQAAHVRALGLVWVSLKLLDGIDEEWDPLWVPKEKRNRALAPEAIAALKEAGLRVAGWGWTYGGAYFLKAARLGFLPSADRAQREGLKVGEIMERYDLDQWQVDAEREYRRGPDQARRADAHGRGLKTTPAIRHSLCSYRFPLTHQPDFPVWSFAPYMEHWSPQVYWLLDNRPLAGALQLQEALRQYSLIRDLPLTPIAPTYPHAYRDGAGKTRLWTTRPGQLGAFFAAAKEIGCAGAGIWNIEQATAGQQEEWAGLKWDTGRGKASARRAAASAPGRRPIGDRVKAIEEWLRPRGYRPPER